MPVAPGDVAALGPLAAAPGARTLPGADGELLYALAGVRTAGTAAAHDAVAARVGAMWAAGRAPHPVRTAGSGDRHR